MKSNRPEDYVISKIDSSRRNQFDRIYSSKGWRRIRARQLGRRPWCDRHLQESGIFVKADQVDHKRPLTAGGSISDPDNLRSLCASCHSQKTRGESTDTTPRPPK